MKRALTQKVKPAPSCEMENNAKEGQTKSALPGVDRRARTSAAMIGLAISMGASGLMFQREGDRAIAAEPLKPEAAVAASPASLEVAVLSPTTRVEAATVSFSPATSKPRIIRHTVQEGQTLWQLAEIYQVEAATIASSNGIASGSVLKVGQTLKIPSVNGVVHEAKAGETVETVSQSYGVEPSEIIRSESAPQSNQLDPGETLAVPGQVDQLLKTKQKVALNHLQEKRDNLKNSLTKIQSDSTSRSAIAPASVEDSLSAPSQLKQFEVAKQSADDSFASIEASANPEVPLREFEFSAPETETIASAEEFVPSQEIKTDLPEISIPEQVTTPAQVNVPAEQAPLAEMSVDVPAALAPTVDEAASTSETIALPLPQAQIPDPQTEEVALVPGLPQSDVALASPSFSPSSVPAAYKVQSGDTLSEIARKHGISLAELAKSNRISNPNLIFPNQTIQIPGSQSTGVSVSSTAAPALTASSASIPSLPSISYQSDPASLEESKPASQASDDSVSLATSEPSLRPSYSQYAASLRQKLSASSGQRTEIAASSIDSSAFPNPVAASTLPSQPLAQTNYVQNLRQEVQRMQERYRNRDAGIQGDAPFSTAASSLPSASQKAFAAPSEPIINPEFKPDQPARALQREDQSLSASPASAAVAQAPSAQQPQVVAVAPTSPEAYRSLSQPSLLGQMVSPDLPPLAAANTYLPGDASFDGYIWPTKGVLTSGYGRRWGRMHKGIDIAAPVGTPIVAAAPGVVVNAGWNSGGYGNLVVIQHEDGSRTLYAHNNRVLVSKGQQVDQGQQIAEMGSTGYSTGPHCHFEVHPAGKGAMNPLAYLPSRGRG